MVKIRVTRSKESIVFQQDGSAQVLYTLKKLSKHDYALVRGENGSVVAAWDRSHVRLGEQRQTRISDLLLRKNVLSSKRYVEYKDQPYIMAQGWNSRVKVFNCTATGTKNNCLMTCRRLVNVFNSSFRKSSIDIPNKTQETFFSAGQSNETLDMMLACSLLYAAHNNERRKMWSGLSEASTALSS